MAYKLLKKQGLCIIIFAFPSAPCTRSSEQKGLDSQGLRENNGKMWIGFLRLVTFHYITLRANPDD